MMKTNSVVGRTNAKNDLLVVLSPMPKLGDGVRHLSNSKGLIRTFERLDDPRLQALGIPLVEDNGKVINLLIAKRRVITTVKVLEAICHVEFSQFAEPVKYKPRAKPTRKVQSIRQLMANAS